MSKILWPIVCITSILAFEADATTLRPQSVVRGDVIHVGDLFAGAFIPGLVLVALYMGWVILRGLLDPAACPALLQEGEVIDDLGRRVRQAMLPPGLLILAVLGSILTGVATPTESAAVGSVGAILLAALRRDRMTAGRENLCDTRRFQAGLCRAKRRSQPSAAGTDDYHVVSVIDERIGSPV